MFCTAWKMTDMPGTVLAAGAQALDHLVRALAALGFGLSAIEHAPGIGGGIDAARHRPLELM